MERKREEPLWAPLLFAGREYKLFDSSVYFRIKFEENSVKIARSVLATHVKHAVTASNYRESCNNSKKYLSLSTIHNIHLRIRSCFQREKIKTKRKGHEGVAGSSWMVGFPPTTRAISYFLFLHIRICFFSRKIKTKRKGYEGGANSS